MAKIIKTYNEVKKGLKTGKGPYVHRNVQGEVFAVSLPNIVRFVDGKWQFDEYVEIGTLEELKEYEMQNQEFVTILKSQYPTIVSRIFKNAYTTLYDAGKQTVASQVLDGSVVDFDSAVLHTNSTVLGAVPTCRYIVSKVNADNSSVKTGVVPTIKPYKRPKEEVLEQLGSKKTGFFLPEITENGVVVLPTKHNLLSCRFFAVTESQFSEEEVYKYLAENMMVSEHLSFDEHDLWRVVEASKDAYDALNGIGDTSDRSTKLAKSLAVINDFCSRRYNPDMSVIESKYGKKKVKEIVDLGPEMDIDPGFVPEMEPEVEPERGYSKIVVEGPTDTKTSISGGKLIMTISGDGQVRYEPVFNEDEKVVTFVPIESGK